MAGPWFGVQTIGEWTTLPERVLVSDGGRSVYARVEMKLEWEQEEPAALVDALSDPAKAEPSADRLVKLGPKAVAALVGEAREGATVLSRLWAISCLREIGDEAALEPLHRILKADQQKNLLRIAAAKAMLDISPDKSMGHLMPLANQPWGPSADLSTEITRQIAEKGSGAAGALLTVCFHSPDQQARMQAASILAAAAGDAAVRDAVIEALSFSEERAKAGVPWRGGPLFLPQASWSGEQPRRLTGALIHWLLWAEAKSDAEVQQQVRNNLWVAAQQAGVSVSNWQAPGIQWAQAFLKRYGGKAGEPSGRTGAEIIEQFRKVASP